MRFFRWLFGICDHEWNDWTTKVYSFSVENRVDPRYPAKHYLEQQIRTCVKCGKNEETQMKKAK